MPLLQTTTAEGALKGMCLSVAPQELVDQEAAYLQDVVLNQPGFVTRRGPLNNMISMGAHLSGRQPQGICSCYDPMGNFRYMVLYTKLNVNSSSAYDLCGAVYDSSFTFLGHGILCPASEQPVSSVFPNGSFGTPGLLVNTSPSIDGGVIISYATGYGSNAAQFICHWRGGFSSVIPDTQSISNLFSYSFVKESTALTGTTAGDISALSPGMVIRFVGIVKSIDSATTATLMSPCIAATAGPVSRAISMTADVMPQRTRGRISCAIGTTAITGYGTRFREHEGAGVIEGITANTGWSLRNYDDSLIAAGGAGVPDIPSDTSLLLATVSQSKSLANAIFTTSHSVNCSDPLPNGNNFHPSMAKGSIVFSFAGYQFYCNSRDVSPPGGATAGAGLGIKGTSRSWIGGPNRHYEMDHSVDDGDFFDAPPAPGDSGIMAGIGGANAGVICRTKQTFAVHGTDPENFSITKIADDGCLGPNAITTWKGNVIWLGYNGVWMYDGVNEPVNIVGRSFGAEWQNRLLVYDPTSTSMAAGIYPANQAYCFVYNDHLYINISNTGSVQKIWTDGVQRNTNAMQVSIFLPNVAATFLSNFNFTGFVPGSPGTPGFAIFPQDSSTTHYFWGMNNFFFRPAVQTDAIITYGSVITGPSSLGPWFHMESRKFDAGDGLWRKNWKQLAFEFQESSTARMFLDTVAGLNAPGVRAPLPFVGTGLFLAARVKFRARDQYMSFRVYEDLNNRPFGILRLGAWQWGYKFARRGAM